ncbi:hypothetical protein [Peribacillus glennii]|uniref:Uncharacterized protein n=1 Tax=Peribacillus glennii TaxID=2303991 RepID=A0A372LK51_9BACI|nr:hypothetical protein [Peribacillus glennii]RFU66586.1 hypothetical protein D0466_00225 [Peribacillus glennii]
MSQDQIEKMLEQLCYFKDVGITHTFSQNQKPILSVICITLDNQIEITQAFRIRYIERQTTKIYGNVKSTALAINEAISSNLETATN